MLTHVILLALAPVFFVMGLGFVAGRLRIVAVDQVSGLNALVMDFALPASLFVATASAPRAVTLAQAPLFLIIGLVMLVVYGAWYGAVRVMLKAGRADASLQALTIAFPNLAGVGLPIAASVAGPAGTVPLAVALAAGSILISPITLVVVELTSGSGNAAVSKNAQVLGALRRALAKPVVLAPVVGIVLSLSGVGFGPVVEACLLLVGHTASGVALFLTGLILSAQSFRLDWKVVGATGVADVIRPLLTASVVFALPIPVEIAKAATLLAAVPSGFFGILFAVNYRLESATAGSMVIASTGFSVVTLAVAIALLFPQ